MDLFPSASKKRGHDILGLSESLGGDQLPYPTLSYANGPGYHNTYNEIGARVDFRTDGSNFSDPKLAYMSMVPMIEEAHGGDDVGVYAIGPWAHLFSGNFEQNSIPVSMAYAARIGAYAEDGVPKKCGSGATRQSVVQQWMVMGALTLLALITVHIW